LATARRNNFVYTERPDFEGIGILLGAASWVGLIGVLNLFYAISVLAGSHIFITTASWLLGDARPAGWLWLIVSLIQLGAAGGILAGKRPALWIGVLTVVAHIVFAAMFIGDVGWLGVLLILIDVSILGALAILMEERART
jgi:hypothetical protein